MAAAVQFDTLDYAKKLQTAGVPSHQAEAHAKALGEALSKYVSLPDDLVALENRLLAKMTALETRLEAKIENVRLQLTARIESVDTKIESVRLELTARIESVRTELSGKIETLKWMFGALVALNIANSREIADRLLSPRFSSNPPASIRQ